jgi:hypothetical protein
MSEYGELQTGQIELLHQQTHDQATDADNCDSLRLQHDSLAAELVKRGVAHDTEMTCPESALAQAAPNYQRGFTDDICDHCAFGQLFQFCNLYKEDYTSGYVCDSFRYYEVLDLEPPHGFLMANGKQTAWATESKTVSNNAAYLVISNGEAFGIAEFDTEPAQVKAKEFDTDEWLSQHRITPRERRQWWPDSDVFYIYRLKSWWPYEGVKLYEDGKIIDEPKLTSRQWKIVSKAKQLPKQIILLDDAVSVSEKQEFVIDLSVKCEELDSVLSATYQAGVKEAETAKELISLYSLALVRNPRMRVSKKNLTAEGGEVGISSDGATGQMDIKQEGEDMPYRITRRDDEYCVVKINEDDTDGEVAGCHDTEEAAAAQLAALRINVEAEEGESAHHTDKPKKRKPKKKEIAESESDTFFKRLKLAAKNILDIVTLAEKEKEVKLFMNEAGIGQKMVNGELWHLTYSTNAFEDREGETFSTKSLERYVAAAEEKGDRGFFNLWHIRGTDFARKEWQEVIGRFLVEAGPYLDDERGRAAAEFFKEYGGGHPELAPEGWGCSPEFRYLPEERATTVYENIWITRTSTLPKMAAANIWTETRQLARKDMSYSKEQIEAAVEVFQDEDFVKSLFSEGETKTAELEAAGIAHKSADEPEAETAQPAPVEVQLNMEELAAEVGKQFQADLTPIGDAIIKMANEMKEMKARLEQLEETKQVKDKTEKPRFIFNMERASESDETTVTDDDGLKSKKPIEAKATESNDPWAQTFGK